MPPPFPPLGDCVRTCSLFPLLVLLYSVLSFSASSFRLCSSILPLTTPSLPHVLPPHSSPAIFLQASVWETKASLTDAQLDALAVLSAVCAERPLPAHLREEPPAGREPSLERKLSLESPLASPNATDGPFERTLNETRRLEDVALENSSEFYGWLSELEAARAKETENKYHRHALVLERHLAVCGDLLKAVNDALQHLNSLKQGQKAVSERTEAVHDTCQRLVAEREELTTMLDALKAKLSYFDEYDLIEQKLQITGKRWPEDTRDAINVLNRIDDCISFMDEHPQYADAVAYSGRFKKLQTKALAAVRSRVQSGYISAVQSVKDRSASVVSTHAATAPSRAPSNGTEPEDRRKSARHEDTDGKMLAELALLQVRFRAALEPLVGDILQDIENRAGKRPEYSTLLRDVLRLHAESRSSLLKPAIESYLTISAPSSGNPQDFMLQRKCEILVKVAQLELQLVRQLYPSIGRQGEAATSAVSPIMNPLCARLYDSLRPIISSSKDLDQLCGIGLVLRDTVSEVASAAGQETSLDAEEDVVKSRAAVLLVPVLRRIIKDVQQRVMHQARLKIRDGVAGYRPTPEDVAMPRTSADGSIEERNESALRASDEGSESSALLSKAKKIQIVSSSAKLYAPVRCALDVLRRTYGVLSTEDFDLLAQETVFAVLEAVRVASTSLENDAYDGILHANLFRISNLDGLREGISNYGADISGMRSDLDFTHVKDYFKRSLAGKLPLFSFARGRTAAGGGKHSQQQTSAQQELERQLKSSCEAVIVGITKRVIEPALGFLTKVSAIRSGSEVKEDYVPLRNHAFASPQRVVEISKMVSMGIRGPLQEAIIVMRSYPMSDKLQESLFGPIESNIAEAYRSFKLLVKEEYSEVEMEAADILDDETIASIFKSVRET